MKHWSWVLDQNSLQRTLPEFVLKILCTNWNVWFIPRWSSHWAIIKRHEYAANQACGFNGRWNTGFKLFYADFCQIYQSDIFLDKTRFHLFKWKAGSFQANAVKWKYCTRILVCHLQIWKGLRNGSKCMKLNCRISCKLSKAKKYFKMNKSKRFIRQRNFEQKLEERIIYFWIKFRIKN